MEEILLVGRTQRGTEVYMSELSQQTLADNGMADDTSGLYLYEACDSLASIGIRVLASLPSPDAAYRLCELLKLEPAH